MRSPMTVAPAVSLPLPRILTVGVTLSLTLTPAPTLIPATRSSSNRVTSPSAYPYPTSCISVRTVTADSSRACIGVTSGSGLWLGIASDDHLNKAIYVFDQRVSVYTGHRIQKHAHTKRPLDLGPSLCGIFTGLHFS